VEDFSMSEVSERRKPELTTTQTAAQIGVSTPTARKLIESGQIFGWRVGKCYRTSPESVTDFLSKNERRAA
jgi:excisionase family DNA binding protein